MTIFFAILVTDDNGAEKVTPIKKGVMDELEITWRYVLSVWWLIVWRAWLGGMLFGGIAGFIAGGVAGVILAFASSATSASLNEIGGMVGGIAGIVAGLTWGVYVVRMALRKKYRGFRLALIPEPSN